jgi:hypothetical protein
MARWLCFERELLSVISFVALGAWERLKLGLMIRQGMGVEFLSEAQLEAWEVEFVVI